MDPIPIPPLPLEGARIQRERITKLNMDEFGVTVGCPGCKSVKDNKRAQAHSDRCRIRIEECLRITPQGAQGLDRRSGVISEALAEGIQRGEQRKKRSDKTTTAIPQPESAAAPAQDLRESPINATQIPREECL